MPNIPFWSDNVLFWSGNVDFWSGNVPFWSGQIDEKATCFQITPSVSGKVTTFECSCVEKKGCSHEIAFETSNGKDIVNINTYQKQIWLNSSEKNCRYFLPRLIAMLFLPRRLDYR